MTVDAASRLAGLRPDGPDEMGRELADGPAVVEATLAAVERLRPELEAARRTTDRLVLVGTGASLAMAQTAAPLFDELDAVVVEASSALFGARDRAFRPRDLAVVISQSGGSPETLAAGRLARGAGATVVAITADPGSPLAAAASIVLHTPSGVESGAATKSELAALAALAALAGALPTDPATAGRCRTSLDAVAADAEGVIAGGLALGRAAHAWTAGFGTAAGLARAAYLLLHEKALLVTVPTTPAEFRHGPIEAAGPGDAVLLVETDPPDARRTAYLDRLARELAVLEIPLVATGPGPFPPSALPVPIPPVAADPPALALLATLLRIQQLARVAAHARGTYRDGFRVLRAIVTAAAGLD